MELMEKYDADFVMHGSDVNLDSNGKDPFAEAKKAGKFRSIDRVDFISSTTIINRLLKATNPDPRIQRRSEDEEDADSFLLTTDRLCQFMVRRDNNRALLAAISVLVPQALAH